VANIWSSLMLHIKKDKLLNLSNIIVMTVTFLLLGIFISVIVYSQTALKYLEEQAQITVFFKDEFTQDKILAYKTNFENDKRILQVNYVSKEDALRIFKEMNKDEPILLESISASILPASLEVKAKNIGDLKSLTEEYKKMDGVEEVQFFEDVVQKFSAWSRAVYIVGFLLVLTFLAVSYSVVIATLKNSINNRGQELEIMKLVGASDDYVKRPFLYQGVFFGLVSSSIASVIILLVNFTVDKVNMFSKGLSLGFIPGFYMSPLVFALILIFILLLSGFLLGLLGSTTAIKKYLKY
jgi:cell division transport system permease protein